MILRTRDIIEQICRGNVPEGYQKTKDGIFPTDWDTQKMKQWVALAERPVTLEDDKRYRLVTVRRGFGGVDLRGEYLGKDILVKNYFRARQGDFLISKRQIAHGACGVVPESLDGAVVSNEYNVFVPNQGTNIEMFNLMMQLPHYTRLFYLMSDGVHIEKLLFKTQDWMRRQLAMPPIEEQQKIAAILTTQDKVIELKEKQLAGKQRQKKYLMQQLLTGKKRLPGFSGEWKNIKLCEVLSERKEKNVEQNLRICSVAVQKGVVDQVEHLGRSYAANDTSNYSVAHYGDIIYTKSPTGDFLYGIVKQNLLQETVAVSPLYGVFTPLTFGLGYFLHTYFQSAICARNYLLPIVQKGAKNTINITNDTFISSKLYLPLDVEEQKAIADTFIAADREIELLRQDIRQEKQKKKALMQLLLTGIVRVTV